MRRHLVHDLGLVERRGALRFDGVTDAGTASQFTGLGVTASQYGGGE
jgi:hypothetical protein